MTKSECWNEINRNNQLITQYRLDIEEKERQIEELNITQNNVEGVNSQLTGCHSTSTTGLAGYAKISRINERFLGRFYDGMSELLNGSSYSSVAQGLESAVTRIVGELQIKKQEITKLQLAITSCWERIQQMQTEIARIEAEERRAAEAAAEQAAQLATQS